MAWLDNYRKAKFRNVSFFVPSAENSGGRRGAIFEFPNRDIPYVEDMGRKARRHTVDAIIVGDNYMSIRNDLINALEKKGSGKLVHPYIGTLDVLCIDYTFSERVEEGRMVKFSMNFVETGLLKFPETIIDTTGDVAAKKLSALQQAKLNYTNRMLALQRARRPVYTQYDNLVNTVEFAIELLEDAKGTVSDASSYRRELTNLFDNLRTALLNNDNFADSLSDLMTFGTNEDDDFPVDAENARNQIDEMKVMFDFMPTETLGATGVEAPSTIFQDFFQTLAVINALGLMSILEYDSVNEAREIRNVIYTKLDELLIATSDDELYTTLYDLQTAVTRDLNRRATSLPVLAEWVSNISLPAIVISHELYGSIDEEQDIIDRNNVSHPLFVPGGVPIEVKISV